MPGEGRTIRFRDLRAWKYKLVDFYQVKTGIKLISDIRVPADRPFIGLHVGGILAVYPGYAWDGPSGPAPDLRCSMRGSLVHDALYQLMRSGKLEVKYRPAADRIFRDCLVQDGMSPGLAWIHWAAVRLFAAKRAQQQEERAPAIRTAP